ncbi:MAG: ArnT family glycosyltransferase [Candidatus Binatia bacterium]
MKMTWSKNQTYILLGLILATGFGLRLWGIWFGLPFVYRADEHHEVFRALELGSGSFNFGRTGKGGYFYLLFVEYGMLFVALKVGGLVESAQDFARYFIRDPSIFYLIGRATTAVIGALNVFLLYRMGLRAYSLGAGLMAALFLSVDFLSVEHSHFITVDMPMTCLATAALLFAVKMAIDGGAGDYKWAALFAALATTTKIPAILLVMPLLIAHFFYIRRHERDFRDYFISRDLWWAIAIFVGVLLVTNPGLIANPPVAGMFGDAGGGNEELAELALPAGAQTEPPNLYAYYIGVLAHSMGWPLLIVSILGVLYALWKRTPADVVLVPFAVVFYLVFASSSHPYLYYPRYILPVIVVLALLAGRLVYDAWPRRGATGRAVAVFAVTALAFLPAYRTVMNSYLIIKTDTRTIAKEWFEENVPEGARVFIEGIKIEPTRLTVPLQDTVENMREYIEYYSIREPGKSKYLGFKIQAINGKTYDLKLVPPRDMQDLRYYKEAGIEYLVIRPEAFLNSRKIGDQSISFYEELQHDPAVTLLKTFEPDPRSRPGPLIEIYKIDQKGVGVMRESAMTLKVDYRSSQVYCMQE